MARLGVISSALGAVAASLAVPTASHASPPLDLPTGQKCGYSAFYDPWPDADPDEMVAEVRGGPLLWDRPFTLHCTIQADDNVDGGTANDAVDAHATAIGITDAPVHLAVMPPNDEGERRSPTGRASTTRTTSARRSATAAARSTGPAGPTDPMACPGPLTTTPARGAATRPTTAGGPVRCRAR